ncbi:VOC family protein [Micromonospora sp. M12]
MSTPPPSIFGQLSLDHIEFYVSDLAAETRRLVDGFGLAVYAATDPADPSEAQSAGLGRGDIRLVLTQPLVDDHPGTAYVERHGDGSPTSASASPIRRLPSPRRYAGRPTGRSPVRGRRVLRATIMGFGDLAHTFVRRPEGADARHLPGLLPRPGAEPTWDSGLSAVDHFAVCLEAGQLDSTVRFYETVLDFRMIFEEQIVVGNQAMNSKVVQSAGKAVTLTLIEPDVSRAAGQIDEFLKNHGGAVCSTWRSPPTTSSRPCRGPAAGSGVPVHPGHLLHDALVAAGAVPAHRVRPAGGPRTRRRRPPRPALPDLHPLGAPRKTFFLELIERLGARTFGSGNVKALYEAVELQRQAERD